MATGKPLPGRGPSLPTPQTQRREDERRASLTDRRLKQRRPDALRVHVGPDTPGETVGIAWLRPKRTDDPDEVA